MIPPRIENSRVLLLISKSCYTCLPSFHLDVPNSSQTLKFDLPAISCAFAPNFKRNNRKQLLTRNTTAEWGINLLCLEILPFVWYPRTPYRFSTVYISSFRFFLVVVCCSNNPLASLGNLRSAARRLFDVNVTLGRHANLTFRTNVMNI